MLRKLQNRQKKGFTLVELLIVIVIIGLLAAVLIPKIAGHADKARETGVITDFRSIQTSVQGVGILNGGFGTNAFADEDAVVSAINKDIDIRLNFTKATEDDTTNGIVIGDLVSRQNDPWSNPYMMLVDQTNNCVLVVSAGADGEFGTVEVSETGIVLPSDATGALENKGADKAADNLILFVGQVEGDTVIKTAGLSKNIQ